MFKALLTIMALTLASPSGAQMLGEAGQVPYDVALINGGPRSDNSQLAGIHVKLAPGWKTYWRVPGPGGIPPRFDWSGSRNLKAVSYVWPAPKIIEAYGVITLGFEHQLLLPVILHPKDPSKPIKARVDMSFGVCEEMCIPAEAALRADLFDHHDTNFSALSKTLKKRATTAKEAGLKKANCKITPKEDDEFLFQADLHFAQALQGRQLLVVETGSEDVWVSQTDTTVAGNRVSSSADLVNFADGPMSLSRSDLRLTLVSGSRAVDIRGCSAG